MTENQKFFLEQSLFFARSLSYHDCLRYLEGLLASCHDEPQVNAVRQVFVEMMHSDAQLELIQTGQLKFKL